MDILDIIKKRKSVRKFKSTPVPEGVIAEMLEAARHAPSPGNSQGYCFGIIRDKALITRLAEAAGNQMWIAGAPMVVACCGDISWDIARQPEDEFGLKVNKLRFGEAFVRYMADYPDRDACMKLFENGAPALPAQYMFLVAVKHGLGACFVGYLDVDRASKILGLPGHIKCLYLLPMGYPDEDRPAKEKKSAEEISFFDRWGA